MESGKLQFDWEKSSEAFALISLGGKGERNFSLLRNLISEASATYPQLLQLRFVNMPPPASRLENWSYCLAAQIVAQWRDLPVENCSVATIVNELGLSGAENKAPLLTALDNTATGIPLSLQVVERVQTLSEQPRQQKLTPHQRQQWLEQEAAGLAEWFTQPLYAPSGPSQSLALASSCLAQLQSNALAVRSKVLEQLQGYFVRLQQAGPRALLTWLASLSEALDGIRADYEAQRHDHLRRENSAWRAYYNLSALVEKPKWKLSSQGRPDWEAALRALATAYDFKLGAEIYTQAAQIVGLLTQQTRMYAASVAQVDAMLARLQGWSAERGSVEPLFVPLLKDTLTERLNPRQIRSELESWVGCSLDQWAALESAQIAGLCEQILARTRPICLEVYAECCRCVLNLDHPDHQTQPTMMAQTPASTPLVTVPADSEKRVSLQVRNAEIRDALDLLARVSQVSAVADDSIAGTVSLTLDNVSVTEALNALIVAGNLTYTKSGDSYTFSQRPSADSSAKETPRLNRAS